MAENQSQEVKAQQAEAQAQNQATGERKQVTITQLQADLKAGIDRKGIAQKYGVPQATVAQWFQHEKLKGLRVRPTSNVELVDDAPDAPAPTKKAAKAASASTDTTSATQSAPESASLKGEASASAAETQSQAGTGIADTSKGAW